MSDKKILFRKSMSGYNREDVNNYIESMNKKYNDEKTEYVEKLEALEKENKQFTENELPELEALRAERDQREALVTEMTETIEKLRAQIEEASLENAKLSDRISELEKANNANMEVYEKSSKFDKVSEQIGSVLLDANAKAESIVSEAQLKAKLHSSEMIERTVEKLNSINEKYAKEITSKTIQMTDNLRALSLSAESFRNETQMALERECNELKESLEETKNIIIGGTNE